MAKSSLDYWREREQEANKNAIKDEAAYNKRIEEIYSYTERNIQRTINDFYARYAMNNGITMNEARKRVREIDMRHYEQLARKYVREHDFSQQANEEMALYNLTMKVNRLEPLKAEINLELLAGYDDIEHEMRKDLLEQAMKVDARYAGILGKSAIGNQKYANQLVNASFMGATFSERLWGVNMPDLRAHLEVELRNGLIQGIHPRELARRFRKHYGGSVQDTERLMVTEMRRLQTAVQKESYERNGYKEYYFITAGDERVCPECAKLHGQHFKVSEMQVGENAPPMHPRCHCSTTAYMDSKKYKDWIEALANGEDVRWDEFQSGEYEKRKAEEAKVEKKSAKKSAETAPVNDSFVPAKSIKEAEEFISKYVDASQFGATGVSYKGVHVDVANEINHALSTIYENFNANKLGGITAPAKNTKLGKSFKGHMGYSGIRKSIVLNRDDTKNLKTFSGKLMEDEVAVKNVLEHPEHYDINRMSRLLKVVIENAKSSGRATVPETIQEAVFHEFGHFWEDHMSRDEWNSLAENMSEYGSKISGYAASDKHEYIAESFASYMKGEDRIDPKLRTWFDGRRKT